MHFTYSHKIVNNKDIHKEAIYPPVNPNKNSLSFEAINKFLTFSLKLKLYSVLENVHL